MSKRWLLLLPVAVVYGFGMFIDVMEVDAAQYAAMAQEMTQTGSYLKIYYRGENYIDKPPLLFWMSALSFHVFGISNFSYKLPSLLFTLLGLFSTYRLARLYYGRWTSYFAVVILASCHAWFQFNNDVRTDAILAGCTVFAIWQLAVYVRGSKLQNLLLAGVGIAGAMMAKGPIGVVVPAVAVATDLLLKRDWRSMFRWQWLLLVPIVLVLLFPMLLGLYLQYDATGGQPTYNGFITSGIRFYFWTQSFGRITGESQWKNDTSPFFFVHTFLWAFLPWCVLFIVALGKRLKKIFFSGFAIRRRQEALALGGIVFPFIAFSLSNYKLPHYIFVLFPLAAIMTAAYVRKLIKKYQRDFPAMRAIQGVISILLLALGTLLCILFPLKNVLVALIAMAGGAATLYFLFSPGTFFRRLLLPSFFAIVTLNFIFNAHVYPELLRYESGNVAAQVAWRSGHRLVSLRYSAYGMDFYNHRPVPRYETMEQLRQHERGPVAIYTDDPGFEELKKAHPIWSDSVLQHFHVSTLKGRFLDPRTRNQAVKTMHLVTVSDWNEQE